MRAYVSITETRCGNCIHLQKVENPSMEQLIGYRCEPNHQFWYPTDKVVDFFAQGCPHFKPKPSEAQK